MPLTKDSREFIECLHSNRVEFLIVGALAVSWHGFPRYSGDIDFFVRPARENALRLMAALEQFGFGSSGIRGPFSPILLLSCTPLVVSTRRCKTDAALRRKGLRRHQLADRVEHVVKFG